MTVLLVWSGVFIFLRLTTAPDISPWQVAVPMRWPEIRLVQSHHFYRRAMEAFGRRSIREAYLALTTALECDPRNYEAATLLLQIAYFQGSDAYGAMAYKRLLQDFPERAQRTAIVQHDTLLALGHLPQLAGLSLQMALEDKDAMAVWFRSLFTALQVGHFAPEFTQANQEALSRLPPHARLLLEAEVRRQRGDRAGAAHLLHEAYRGALNPIYAALHVRSLSKLGEQGRAMLLIGLYGPVLSATERHRLQYFVSKQAGDPVLARLDFVEALRVPLTKAVIGELTASLVDCPDAESFLRLHTVISGRHDLDSLVTGGEMWLAALACNAPVEAKFWAQRGRERQHAFYPNIKAINFKLASADDPTSPFYLISVMTLPREVIYSLLERMAPPIAPAGKSPLS